MAHSAHILTSATPPRHDVELQIRGSSSQCRRAGRPPFFAAERAPGVSVKLCDCYFFYPTPVPFLCWAALPPWPSRRQDSMDSVFFRPRQFAFDAESACPRDLAQGPTQAVLLSSSSSSSQGESELRGGCKLHAALAGRSLPAVRATLKSLSPTYLSLLQLSHPLHLFHPPSAFLDIHTAPWSSQYWHHCHSARHQ